MAKSELGTKRIDPETGRKFYDLNKDPIVSPYTGKTYPLSYFESGGRQSPGGGGGRGARTRHRGRSPRCRFARGRRRRGEGRRRRPARSRRRRCRSRRRRRGRVPRGRRGRRRRRDRHYRRRRRRRKLRFGKWVTVFRRNLDEQEASSQAWAVTQLLGALGRGCPAAGNLPRRGLILCEGKVRSRLRRRFPGTVYPPARAPAASRNDGAIAQLGERLHGMQEVSGSIPLGSTI